MTNFAIILKGVLENAIWNVKTFGREDADVRCYFPRKGYRKDVGAVVDEEGGRRRGGEEGEEGEEDRRGAKRGEEEGGGEYRKRGGKSSGRGVCDALSSLKYSTYCILYLRLFPW